MNDPILFNADDWQCAGASPDQAAEITAHGWSVYNAPRPLCGEGAWRKGPCHGIFYAAGPLDRYEAHWQSLDASPCVLTTNAEIEALCRAEAAERGCAWEAILEYYPLPELARSLGYPWRGEETE